MTKFVFCFKRGCPYCQRVQDKINELKLKDQAEISYAEEDFSTEDFKKKYGDDTTFPLCLIVKDDKKVLRINGGSEEIISKMEDHIKESMSS